MSPIRRALLVTAGQSVVVAGAAAAAGTNPDESDVVAHLVSIASRAHETLMRGDIAAYRATLSLASDFTLMAPFGGPPARSGHYTEDQWNAIGRFFRHGQESSFELIRAYPSRDQVVLVAVERSHVEVGTVPAQEWSLRVTLVFRKDGDRWYLAHRHADPLVAGISVAESAKLAKTGQ
jgi:ketosteroid isomerase-like protein